MDLSGDLALKNGGESAGDCGEFLVASISQ